MKKVQFLNLLGLDFEKCFDLWQKNKKEKRFFFFPKIKTFSRS